MKIAGSSCAVITFQGGAMSTAAAAAGGGLHPSTSPSAGGGASCMYSYVDAYV